MVLAHAWPGAPFVFAFLFGFFAFPLYALSVAHMNDFVDPDGYVEAAGGMLLVFAVGAAIGPLFASAVISAVGVEFLFAYTAFIHAVTAGFAIFRMRKRTPVAEEEQVPFTDSLLYAQTVSVVDPLSSSGEGAEATSGEGAAETSPAEARPVP